eukprot:Cvel_30622.t1-p1 / transcript=Cvel_30622.t1 / gene=Cvel_30622 / organism=Chromera_velia_CCMP2878 / gene_product=hypothetical protein / transcript_product=hypothetical protein / location=Cvel_scaffold4398:1-3477(-) / protein_length=133 / sequence_SO=supercontig / SO=protein_coding / is_pseudo=false
MKSFLLSEEVATKFLYIQIVVFVILSALTWQQILKFQRMLPQTGSVPVNVAGAKTRLAFGSLLLAANLSRCIALFCEWVVIRRPATTQFTWIGFCARTVPALLFMTAFSVVVLFWAQTPLHRLPLLRRPFTPP